MYFSPFRSTRRRKALWPASSTSSPRSSAGHQRAGRLLRAAARGTSSSRACDTSRTLFRRTSHSSAGALSTYCSSRKISAEAWRRAMSSRGSPNRRLKAKWTRKVATVIASMTSTKKRKNRRFTWAAVAAWAILLLHDCSGGRRGAGATARFYKLMTIDTHFHCNCVRGKALFLWLGFSVCPPDTQVSGGRFFCVGSLQRLRDGKRPDQLFSFERYGGH